MVQPRGSFPGGALEFYFDGDVPHESLKWGSKELTPRVKYGVLGTETIPDSVETRVYGTAQLPRVRRLYNPSIAIAIPLSHADGSSSAVLAQRRGCEPRFAPRWTILACLGNGDASYRGSWERGGQLLNGNFVKRRCYRTEIEV